MAGIVSRAFAWSGGGTVTTGFTAQGNLIYETDLDSATVGLGPSTGGPNGYVYWQGPRETLTDSYIIAYASNPGTHTGANGVASQLQFWSADDGTEFTALVTFLSNQGIGNLNPATPADATEALDVINAISDWRAIRVA
tara:strand:+ start:70 stop:486 length:417 start_codon:yes stop_codon:yes gene_type:complete